MVEDFGRRILRRLTRLDDILDASGVFPHLVQDLSHRRNVGVYALAFAGALLCGAHLQAEAVGWVLVNHRKLAARYSEHRLLAVQYLFRRRSPCSRYFFLLVWLLSSFLGLQLGIVESGIDLCCCHWLLFGTHLLFLSSRGREYCFADGVLLPDQPDVVVVEMLSSVLEVVVLRLES